MTDWGSAFHSHRTNLQDPQGASRGRIECLAFNGWLRSNERRINLSWGALWATLFSNSF